MDIYATTQNFFPNFFLQKYIPFGDCDYRVELIEGEVLSCYSRQKTTGFKTNVHAGRARCVPCQYDENCVSIAKASAKALGIPLTIVDLIKSTSDEKYYVLEVNDVMGAHVECFARYLGYKLDNALSGIDERKTQLLAAYIIAEMDKISSQE
jgi:ribosomal protein S6--L-glutamate ligase